MRLVEGLLADRELTYSDVFLVPSYSDISSRMDVDLTPPDGVGTSIPVAVANMTAISGRRMAETVARRGGLAVFPQDVELEAIADMVSAVKKADLVLDTAITLTPHDNVNTARALINKRSHGAVIVVDEQGRPVGIFTEGDQEGADPFTHLSEVMSHEPIVLPAWLDPEAMFEELAERRVPLAPVVDESGILVGVITRPGALRATVYEPAADEHGRLLVAAAVGISGDAGSQAAGLSEVGVDVVVVDTAHGHQARMLEALKEVRATVDDRPVVAGNVVTARAVTDLIDAGADIVKVGVGPGAMCTTRMMTGVGRPQFSAVVECAAAARSRVRRPNAARRRGQRLQGELRHGFTPGGEAAHRQGHRLPARLEDHVRGGYLRGSHVSQLRYPRRRGPARPDHRRSAIVIHLRGRPNHRRVPPAGGDRGPVVGRLFRGPAPSRRLVNSRRWLVVAGGQWPGGDLAVVKFLGPPDLVSCS